MQNSHKYFLLFGLVAILLLLGLDEASAQCAMCKGVGESNMQDGGKAGIGLNTGIFYLFLTPYCIVMILGGIWWWNNKQREREQLIEMEG